MSEHNIRPSSGSTSQPKTGPPEPQDEEGVDLREVLSILNANKWLIASVTAVVLALALLYAFFSTPIYEANALIQIDQQQSPLAGGSGDVLSMFMAVPSPTGAEIAVMKSRSVLEPTVEKENLNIVINDGDLDYSALSGKPGIIITELAVPAAWMDEPLTLTAKGGGRYVLYSPDGEKILTGQVGKPASTSNDAVKILVSHLDVPAGESFEVNRIYNQIAILLLQERFSASQLGDSRQDTGMVALRIQGPHPLRLKDILNTIVDQYIKQNVKAQAAQARQSLAFINKQLPKIKQTLDAALSELTKYRVEKGVVDLDAQAQSLLQSLINLQGQLTQINLTQSSMQQRFAGSYPGMKALQSQRRDIVKRIHAVQAQIDNLPAKEKDYVGLLQQVQVYQQLYTALLAKSQDLKITQAATMGTARVVDYAVTPVIPIEPRKALIGVLGLIIGLFLGVLAAFLKRLLFRGVTAADELEEELGLPVYAVVQHSATQISAMRKRKARKDEGLPLLAAEFPDDIAVESVRSLRASLGVALLDSSRKVVCFVGTAPGVGKSFMTSNTAHIVGASGQRVLVIDADLRRGHLYQYFNTRQTPGLSEFLMGSATLKEVIQPSGHQGGVDMIATGTRATDPYTLISSPRFSELLEQRSRDYDMVFVDVPPVLAVAEGLAVARLATVNFLVVKAGQQTKHEIRMAMNRMQQNDANVLGFVLNDLTKRASSYAAGRYGYAYQYKYDRKD